MALCALGLCLSQTGTQITQDDNTRKQPLSDASVKIDGSTSWRSAVDSVVFDWSQVHLNWLVLLLLLILRIWLANAKRSLWRWWRNIFAERLSGCAEFHMVRLIEPLSLHVLPKLGKTWLVLLVDVFFTLFLKCFWAARSCSDVWLSFRSFGGTGWNKHHWWQPMKATTLKQTVWTWMVRLPDSLCKHQQESELLWHLFCDAVTLCFRCACWCVFYFVFEMFLSCSKLQWCVVEFQELWWDRHHWWQPMKATTLKQTVWTWMVRLPDSLCKHQQESEITIPVCALREARTEWIQSGIGIHRHMQRSCLLDDSVCVFPWPCVLWGCVCRRQEHRMTTQESNHCLMPVWR